jgi:hypothetical protein
MSALDLGVVVEKLLQVANIAPPFVVYDVALGCGFQIANASPTKRTGPLLVVDAKVDSVAERDGIACLLAEYALELTGLGSTDEDVHAVAETLQRQCCDYEDKSSVKCRLSPDDTQRLRALALKSVAS